MPKNRINFKKLILYVAGSAAAITPIAMAAGCTSSETEESAPITKEEVLSYAKKQLEAVRVLSTSLNDNLRYNKIPAPSGEIVEFRYYAENADTLEAAKGVAASAWSAILPKKTVYQSNWRSLWVKVITKTPNLLTDDESYFNITSSSNIRAAKHHVESAPEFAGVSFAKFKLKGFPDYVTYEFNNRVPWGTTFVFVYKETPATPEVTVDPASINKFITEHRAAFQTVDDLKAKLQVELITTGPQYVLTKRKISNADNYIDLSEFSINPTDPRQTALAHGREQVNKITVRSGSTHNSLSFDNASPALGNLVTAYEFVYGDAAPTFEEFFAKARRSYFLPKQAAFEHDKRRLYVRILSLLINNWNGNENFIDITALSGLDKVKSLVDVLPTYNLADLTKVKLSGNLQSVQVDTSAVELPQGTKLQFVYQTSSGAEEVVSAADLPSYLRAHSSELQSLDNLKTKLQVELAVTESAKYQLNNPKRTTSATYLDAAQVDFTPPPTNLNFSKTDVISYASAELSRIKLNLATSSHDALNYSFSTPAKNAGIASYEYLVTPHSTKAEVASISAAEWKAALPSQVDFDLSRRHLWARITPSNSSLLTADERLIDLTASSEITKVLAKVDALPEYMNANLQAAVLTGDYTLPILNVSAVTIPRGAELVFSYINSDTGQSYELPASQLATYLSQNATQYSTLEALKAKIQLKLRVTNALLYKLVNNKATTSANYFNAAAFSFTTRTGTAANYLWPRRGNMSLFTGPIGAPGETLDLTNIYFDELNDKAYTADLTTGRVFVLDFLTKVWTTRPEQGLKVIIDGLSGAKRFITLVRVYRIFEPANDLYAIGNDGTVARYTNNAWVKLSGKYANLPADGRFVGVSDFNARDENIEFTASVQTGSTFKYLFYSVDKRAWQDFGPTTLAKGVNNVSNADIDGFKAMIGSYESAVSTNNSTIFGIDASTGRLIFYGATNFDYYVTESAASSLVIEDGLTHIFAAPVLGSSKTSGPSFYTWDQFGNLFAFNKETKLWKKLPVAIASDIASDIAGPLFIDVANGDLYLYGMLTKTGKIIQIAIA